MLPYLLLHVWDSQRSRMRSEAGLGKFASSVVLGKCAMRRGGCSETLCLVDSKRFIITSNHRRYVLNCSDGCQIMYHFSCWQYMKKNNYLPNFKMALQTQRRCKQDQAMVSCPTDGCSGHVLNVISHSGDTNEACAPRVEYEAPGALRKPKKHKKAAPCTNEKSSRQNVLSQDSNKKEKNVQVSGPKMLLKRGQEAACRTNKELSVSAHKSSEKISEKVLQALGNVRLIEHTKTNDMNEGMIIKQKAKANKQAKKKPMHLFEFNPDAIMFTEQQRAALGSDGSSYEDSLAEKEPDQTHEVNSEDCASSESSASLYEFGKGRHKENKTEEELSPEETISALAVLRRGTNECWHTTWKSIIIEGIDVNDTKEAQMKLSILHGFKDAVEWRAFPKLRACAVQFATSSEAQEIAQGITGEGIDGNRLHADALNEFPTREILRKTLDKGASRQEIVPADADEQQTTFATEKDETDCLWFATCNNTSNRMDGGEAKLLALLQNEPSTRSSPKLDVWLKGQLNATVDSQSSLNDLHSTVHPHPERSASISSESVCPIDPDAQHSLHHHAAPCTSLFTGSKSNQDKESKMCHAHTSHDTNQQVTRTSATGYTGNKKEESGTSVLHQFASIQTENVGKFTENPAALSTVSSHEQIVTDLSSTEPIQIDEDHQKSDEQKWAACVDCLYIFPCQYQYLKKCQQASGRLSLERKWFKNGVVTRTTALFFCNTDDTENMSLEGVWKPMDCSQDPICWDWVLRDAPLSFQKTPELKEIYSLDSRKALSMLCEQGICLTTNKAQALLDLFLGKKQSSLKVHTASSIAERGRMEAHHQSEKHEDSVELGSYENKSKQGPSVHKSTKSESEGASSKEIQQHSRGPTAAEEQPLNPLDRLFPFMKQSTEKISVAKENCEPKQASISNPFALPAAPPGITLPRNIPCGEWQEATDVYFPFSSSLHEPNRVAQDESSKLACNDNRQGGKARKMPCPPGFHFVTAPRPKFSRSFFVNPKDKNVLDTSDQKPRMGSGEKYVPPHLQGRP